MEAAVHAIGIYNAKTIHALGEDERYHRLFNNGCLPYFMGYSALAMGLQNRPRNVCIAAEKQTLARILLSPKTKKFTFNRVCKLLFLNEILKKFAHAKPKRILKKRAEDSTLLIG